MPKDKKDLAGKSPEDIAAQEEKFRTFFSTSVADVPQEMMRRDEEEKEQQAHGVFGRLFGRGKARPKPEETENVLEIPTGEILLDEEAKVVEQEADLELMLRTADPVPDLPLRAPAPAKEPEPQAEPQRPAEPEPPKPAEKPAEKSAPAPQPAKKPEDKAAVSAPAENLPEKKPPEKKNKKHRKSAPQPLLPQEEQEEQEMQQLKALINGMSAPQKPAAAPAPAKPEKAEPAEPAKPVSPAPEIVFAAAEEKKPERKSIFEMMGVPEDEKPCDENVPAAKEEPVWKAVDKEDTMSLPLLPLEEETSAAPQPAAEEAQPAEVASTEAESAPEEEPAPAEDVPELTSDKLRRMSAELTLRCTLAGILAVVLLHFGLVAEGLLPAMAALDPAVAPGAFYAANLLLFAASLCVGYPVLRDGLRGLKGRPSADTMPALAAVAALLQAVIAMLNAQAYHDAQNLSLLTGIAALGLFMALLGSRVMLAAVRGGYELVSNGVEHQGAYRAKDKDLIRALARDLEQKDPWVLLDRPLSEADRFVEQSLDERASERRMRKVSYILLGVAAACGLLALLKNGGVGGLVCSVTAALCMGAPLSATLVAGMAALRLQRTAATVGAVVPGWAAIEELGGIDTVQVDADELFTAESATLEDIRVFKGGRIDKVILYAASVLNQSCATLRGLFRQIIEERTEILFPVKDMEIHRGLGYAAWCDNKRILIGSRKYMEQEGITLPDEEYEASHSKNGELQILYLAVAGSLHAMFVLRYVGGRNVARSLAVLQKENIRLLVTSEDPSLTARHISEAYHLPEGMVTLLDQEQCEALDTAHSKADDACCMIHLKGFASLTGGLQAADQAQNAESSATTIQLASVWFSVVIAALLAYAGNLSGLTVARILIYQAAWSGLSLGMCALKQHN